jgi:sec-independent protein translocase protein TatA
MGGFSLWHWLIVGLVILLLFGKGRFSDMMGDVAKGLRSFKKGMTEEEEAAATQRQIAAERVETPAADAAAAPATEAQPATEADRH